MYNYGKDLAADLAISDGTLKQMLSDMFYNRRKKFRLSDLEKQAINGKSAAYSRKVLVRNVEQLYVTILY